MELTTIHSLFVLGVSLASGGFGVLAFLAIFYFVRGEADKFATEEQRKAKRSQPFGLGVMKQGSIVLLVVGVLLVLVSLI